MAERNFSTERSKSGKNRTWTMVIAGTAIMLLAAGIMLQVTRPTSAYPEDGNSAAGKATTAGAAGQPQAKTAKIVAKVGKDQITYDELAAECVDRFYKDVLDDLINRKIIQQACDAQGIEVTEGEVQKEIQNTAKKFGLAVDQYLQMLEADRNLPERKYRTAVVWPMLALRKLAGENIEVTKAELKNAFIKNYGERVKAKAIIMDNSRRAREVWEQAQEHPEEFEQLARKHSIDRNSAAMDGVIPPIQRSGKADKLEEVAFKMKEGDISPMVQVGPNQIVILKCEGRTVPAVKDISEVESILMEELREEKTQMAVASTFKKLKDEARVDNYITQTSTGGKAAGKVRQTGATSDDAAPAGKPATRSAKPKKSTPAE